MSGFVLHPDAIKDEEIWDYIADANVAAADRVLEEIHEAIRRLVQFPELGYFRPDLTSWPLRFHPIRDFLVAYAPEEKPLVVVAALHGRRNPRVIAALLRERT